MGFSSMMNLMTVMDDSGENDDDEEDDNFGDEHDDDDHDDNDAVELEHKVGRRC